MSTDDVSPAAVPDVTALAQTIRNVLGPDLRIDDEIGRRHTAGCAICTAHDALAALLALVERLTDERDRARAGCDDIYEMAKKAEAELERTRQEHDEANARWQEARHPFDESEHHALCRRYQSALSRAERAERERDAAQTRERIYRDALVAMDTHGKEFVRAALAAADTPQPDRETTVAPQSGAG